MSPTAPPATRFLSVEPVSRPARRQASQCCRHRRVQVRHNGVGGGLALAQMSAPRAAVSCVR